MSNKLRDILKQRGWRRAVSTDLGLKPNRILDCRKFSKPYDMDSLGSSNTMIRAGSGFWTQPSPNRRSGQVNRRVDLVQQERDNANY